ncbi:3-oxoacyl-ACP reductase [Leucobacter sp. M11]|uniref:3-oxoacyl-ACP reductase n=1 Tax=Leucobacter sp. M11 TaxID=2993565 RepID=UPI002D7FA581|nr:3-oxoacyl-ACP reductase [Leucobacter sp. M11]MEB4615634.1 3-oxoacyl-ACP reductase [Leucobacter sp. M11]
MSTPVQPDSPHPSGVEPTNSGAGDYPMPSSQPMLMRGVRWGIIATVAAMIVFAVIGFLVSDSRGLLGGLIGAAIGGAMLLATVGSIAFGNRFVRHPMYLQVFMGIVLGTWVLKLVGFVVAALLLRDQPWLDPKILFISLVATILVSIIIDVVIVAKARVPYDTELP